MALAELIAAVVLHIAAAALAVLRFIAHLG